jgi:von Willebrand factor type A domain
MKMHRAAIVRPALQPLILIAALAAAGCPSEPLPLIGSYNWDPAICQSGASCCDEGALHCTGDPDGRLICTCHKSWSCDGAQQTCSQSAPDTPDGGNGWTCSIDPEFERCEKPGWSPPAGKNGWSCKQEWNKVVCQRAANTPDGTGNWACSYDGATKKCIRRPGAAPSSPPPIIKGSPGTCTNGTPDVLIVLDRSGSMATGSGGLSKWGQATSAVNTLVATYQGQARFGLLLFPLYPQGGPCDGGVVNVPVGVSTQGAIKATLGAATPGGGTPIAASLANALSSLKSVNPGQKKYVVLVTDGSETCQGKPVDQVKVLLTAQIETYVVGFGSGVDAAQLNAMALAGKAAQSGATSYYSADSLAQLIAAMKAAVGDICKN